MKKGDNRNRKNTRPGFFHSESAGATVIAAVLLLSIIFTVLAVVRIEYVPEWKNEAEQLHMSEVQDEMTELKSTADMFSLFMASDPNSSAYGFSVTVPLRMGGGEIPILEPSKSSGTLAVNTENFRMTINPRKSSVSVPSKILDCGGITYRSNNREYVDQTFRYEGGALIISQDEKSLMKQPPSFKITKSSSGNYTVSIQAIKIEGDPDTLSSNTGAALQLTGINSETVYDSSGEDIDSFSCTILTKYPEAWVSYINDTAQSAGLEYDTDYSIYCPGSEYVYFEFVPENNTLEKLYISKTVLGATLGAGSSLTDTASDGNSGDDGGNETGGEENESVMELGTWYTFELSDKVIDMAPLEDYETGTDFSIDTSGVDEELEDYSPENEYIHNLKGNSLEDTFSFDSFSKFESNVSKVTVRMIYRSEENPTTKSNLKVSGNYLDKLEPKNYNQQNWYLFNETKEVSIDDPSELNLYLNIESTSGKKAFHIDYLAIRLN